MPRMYAVIVLPKAACAGRNEALGTRYPTSDAVKMLRSSSSAPVTALHQGARLMLETLDRNFTTNRGRAAPPDEHKRDRDSYALAIKTLEKAGIPVSPDGMERYAALRRDWEPLVRHVAPALGYTMLDIDRRGSRHREGVTALL